VLWLLVALVVAAVVAVVIDRTVVSKGSEASRPDLQRVLDGLVSGPQRVAPGATAYVSGAGRRLGRLGRDRERDDRRGNAA
jgi:hypothetical protein